jgi:hypothetical protein
LFGASVLILFGIIHWVTSAYMSNSLDAAVDSDITELTDTLQVGRDAALVALIRERARQTAALLRFGGAPSPAGRDSEQITGRRIRI